MKNYTNKKILKVINLILPAQNPTVNTMLNPILGQAGVNSFEFNKIFMEKSKNLTLNVLVSVKVYVFIDKTFDVVVGKIPLSYSLMEEQYLNSGIKILVENVDIKLKEMPLSLVYKILFLLAYKGYYENITKTSLSSILGTIKSMHIAVINDVKLKNN